MREDNNKIVLTYYEVTFRCIHGTYLSINLGYIHAKHVFIKALQIKTRRKFENLKQCIFLRLALSKLEFAVENNVYKNSFRDL